jgi:PAS domain S-box-containing protein
MRRRKWKEAMSDSQAVGPPVTARKTRNFSPVGRWGNGGGAIACVRWCSTAWEGVSVSDENGIILYTNPAEDRMFGYECGELIGQHVTVQNTYQPEENARIVNEVIAQLKEQGVWFGEFSNRKKDGTAFTTFARITALDISDKRYLVCVQEDVTERKREEEILRASERALQYQHKLTRIITDNATACLFMMNAEGRCTFMNPAAEQVTGYSFAEVEGRTLHDVIHHTHPDGRPFPMSECPIDRALPQNRQVQGHEDVFIRKDGTFFPVVCAANPITENGVPVGTVVEVRDVTQEKQAERAIRESEERYRLIASVVNDAIWDWDLGTKELRWNEGVQTLFGYTSDEVAPDIEWWYERIHPADRERVVSGVQRVIDQADTSGRTSIVSGAGIKPIPRSSTPATSPTMRRAKRFA